MPSKPPRHRSHPPAARPSAAARGYDRRWQRLRKMILAREPLCRLCQAPALHVDHITALEAGGTNHEDNLQALCPSCHSRKTVHQDHGFGRA